MFSKIFDFLFPVLLHSAVTFARGWKFLHVLLFLKPHEFHYFVPECLYVFSIFFRYVYLSTLIPFQLITAVGQFLSIKNILILCKHQNSLHRNKSESITTIGHVKNPLRDNFWLRKQSFISSRIVKKNYWARSKCKFDCVSLYGLFYYLEQFFCSLLGAKLE